jgi:hypothetical protein
MTLGSVKDKLMKLMDEDTPDKAYEITTDQGKLVVLSGDDLEWAKRILRDVKITVTEIPKTDQKYKYRLYVPPSQGFCKLIYSDSHPAMGFFMSHYRGDEYELTEDGKVIDSREDWYS